MSDAKFIDPTKPLSPGLDYVALRQQGLDLIQRLAGQVWTDYNEHDPGVTILEQLCYALTELSYRSELPIEDLLAEPGTNAIDPRRQGLVPPEAILPCSPLTESDYRKLIVDQVPAVGNAWLRAYESSGPGAVNGLYEIDLYVPGTTSSSLQQDVIDQVRRAYSAARGLCEDLHSVRVLESIPTTLTARIAIEPSASPESVEAQILYRVSCLLAPELRRQPLDAMLANGQTPASIFVGPLPQRGFISDVQLNAPHDRFTIGDITRVLRETEGVTAVHSVRVSTRGASMDTNGGASAIAVPSGGILALDTRPIDRTFGIRLFQDHVECRPKPDVVRRELARLWADHRRTYDTLAECERLLSFPKGSSVDFNTYYLLQHQFPGVYGISERGVPTDATDVRRAQASQLKGFLLVFEQLLADGFARLASATRGASRERVYEYLDASFPELASLLKPSYRTGVRVMESPERRANHLWRTRRAMLAMYAETAEPIVRAPAPGSPGGDSSEDAAVRVRGQLGFLRYLPRMGSRRGTGFDYTAPPTLDNVSGFEIRTRLQLGLRPATPQPFEETLRQFGLSDMPEAPPIADRELMMRYGRHIEQHFTPVPQLFERSGAADDARWNELTEELLIAAAAPHHYRIGRLPGDQPQLTVACRAPSQPVWQLAGTFDDESHAISGASKLLRIARAIHRQARRFYIVEHPLLRFAPHIGADFEHGFTISAVICVPVRDAVDPDYRARVCNLLRRNTPAHIVVHGCFVRFSRISAFETLYWQWRDALRRSEGREDACDKLREFLTHDLR